MQISASKNRIFACSVLLRIEYTDKKAARPQCDIALYSALDTGTFLPFINFTLPASCNVHRPRAHPSWMTAPIQGRRFCMTIVTLFLLRPRCSTRPNLLGRIKQRATRVSKRSRLFAIVAIMVTGHQSDVAEELSRSKPQDDILISFADWTLALLSIR